MKSEGQLYLDQIKKLKLIKKDEQIELMKKWKETNNDYYFNQVYESNLKIIPHIALRYRNVNHHQFMDLIQEGNIALLQGLRKYDPEKSTSISYYSLKFVKKIVLRYVMNYDKIIKYKFNKSNIALFENPNGAKRIFNKDEEKTERIKEFSKQSGISLDKLQSSISHLKLNIVSLDQPVMSDSSKDYNCHDVISSSVDVYKQHEDKDINNNIWNTLNSSNISPRNKRIIKDYFLKDKTYQTIGDEYGLTRERIRQIIKTSLKKVKNNLKEINL